MNFIEKVRYNKLVKKVNQFNSKFEKMTDNELKKHSLSLRKKIKAGESLEKIKAEAFALVRESAFRVLRKKPYDVQMIGGGVLDDGHVAEMATGSGKTLTSVAPAYLNALKNGGVHIVTVNDYLAQRDKEEMGKIFNFLGLSVSWIHPGMNTKEKQYAYSCDVVYGTSSEFGFDYLRDNMVENATQRVQRELNYCIIDEVDSILIDEARTPLIISSKGNESSDLYVMADIVSRVMQRGEDEKELTKIEKIDLAVMETKEDIEKKKDFQVNEKNQTITLTDRGIKKAEHRLGISNLGAPENAIIYHHLLQAIRARYLMKKNIDYIVENNEVLIIDTSTGRTMEGRRFSDGLHQALEAKEGVDVQSENTTSATITLQNYFRLYNKISGMTGTAMTEKDEFKDIYGMNVISVPDHKPNIRKDEPDLIYLSLEQKEEAIYKKAKEYNKVGRPVLIGTSSIESSERLSALFNQKGLSHELLNAKSTFNQDLSTAKKEAFIIAEAGRLGKITIATNMAGRGTDILLGGNPEYLAIKQMMEEGCSEELVNSAIDFTESEDDAIRGAQRRYQELLSSLQKRCTKEKEEVLKLGGLVVIGTERHDSRRIDNQLIGRSGRQGEPGSTVFMVSLDDKLFKVHGENIVKTIKKYYSDDNSGEPVFEGGKMAKVIRKAQQNIENLSFNSRKDVLDYDEIDSVQREEIYNFRNKLLDNKDISKEFDLFLKEGINFIENNLTDEELINNAFLSSISQEIIKNRKSTGEIVNNYIKELFDTIKSMNIEGDIIGRVKNTALLHSLDYSWKQHIILLQNLKDSTRLTGFGSIQPIDVYKNEASDLFVELKQAIGKELITTLVNLHIDAQ